MIQNNKGVESRLRKLAEDFELPQGSLILINFNSTQNKSNHNSTRLALIKVGDSRISKKNIEKISYFRDYANSLSRKLGFSDDLTTHSEYGFFTVPKNDYWSNYHKNHGYRVDYIDCTVWAPDIFEVVNFYDQIRLDFAGFWEIISQTKLVADLKCSKTKFTINGTIVSD